MFKRYLAPFAFAAVALLGTATPAQAAPGDRAHWGLNEAGTPSTAFDDSGNGNDGTNFNIRGTGKGYVFNGTNSRVIVPTSLSLNPGASDFSWSVELSMTQPPADGETYDVLRKGITTTAGGDYKFEVKGVGGTARARCVAKDGSKVVAGIMHGRNLADGQRHTVTCRKTATTLSVTVDGSTKTRTATVKSISNSSSLAVGAKAEDTAKTGFDWFMGTVYDARVW